MSPRLLPPNSTTQHTCLVTSTLLNYSVRSDYFCWFRTWLMTSSSGSKEHRALLTEVSWGEASVWSCLSSETIWDSICSWKVNKHTWGEPRWTSEHRSEREELKWPVRRVRATGGPQETGNTGSDPASPQKPAETPCGVSRQVRFLRFEGPGADQSSSGEEGKCDVLSKTSGVQSCLQGGFFLYMNRNWSGSHKNSKSSFSKRH